MKRFSPVILVVLAICLCGCVERRMTITSDPPGALVFVSDVEKGRTPVTIEFTWYGDYDIMLRLDGHKTIKTHAEINAPWYEIPPLDLLSAMAPWTYRDHRYLNYKMEELVLPGEQELIRRAEQMQTRDLESVPK